MTGNTHNRKNSRRGTALLIAVLLIACVGIWLAVMTAGWQSIRMESDLVCAKAAAKNLQACGRAWAKLHSAELRNLPAGAVKKLSAAALPANGNIEISPLKDNSGAVQIQIKTSASSGKSTVNLSEKYPLERL